MTDEVRVARRKQRDESGLDAFHALIVARRPYCLPAEDSVSECDADSVEPGKEAAP
ncbi:MULTISPECIES: hypothetical protein [unclassified Burkholderia]|uniref:hypothetical protein n=1 Tax=unclassified Burkholderia TaxID=2613784 RepID=UPI0015C65A52|nr:MULTISPECIES: hypothetical protein [unclassified Burkholderia]MCA8062678.1 hypothetical protein [Burkholderia sp. AU38729]